MPTIDKDKTKATIGTILFHVLLLIALIFLALTTPLPLPGEEGVEVDLGSSNQGKGMVQPEQPVEAAAAVPIPTPQPAETAEEEIVSEQNDEVAMIPEEEKKETVVTEKKVEVKKQPEKPKEIVEKEPEVEPEKPKPVVNQRALFKGTSSSTEQASEGITGNPGDQGQPNGLRDVKRYDGQGGQGDGPSYSLGGRGAKYLDRPSSEFSEQGDVVVDIWVDRKGVVQRAQISAKGTTIIDGKLRNRAMQAALNSTFSEDLTALELQKGTITYTFIISR